MKKPLVLIINGGGARERGGMGGVIRNLIATWGTQANSPRVVVLDSRGLGSVLLSPFYLLATIGAILWYHATEGVSILHINMAERLSVLRKGVLVGLARGLGIPTLLHLHAAEFVEFTDALPKPLRSLMAAMLRSATRVVVLGDVWKQHLTTALHVPAERIVIVPNSVPAVRRRDPEAIAQGGKPLHLVFAARLQPQKGVSELLEALASPGVKELDWRLTMAGVGRLEEYQAEAKMRGIADRVTFPGWLDGNAVHALLETADVYLLPSHAEGLPLGVLEALSAGLPVLCCPVGSIPEHLENERTALIVPPKDAPALAAALRRLITDGDLRRRLAIAGAALYDRKFSMASFATAIAALYATYGKPPKSDAINGAAAGAKQD